MSLTRRILVEKRSIVLPIAVGLIVNAALYGLVVYPLTRRVEAAEGRAAAAQAKLLVAQQTFTHAKETVTGKGKADEELQRFYGEVLPVDLAAARRITYLRLAQLADQANLRYERRTVRTEQDENSRLARLNMTMVLEGEYDDIRRFIYQLETAPEFVVIEDVALARGQEGETALVLTLEVSTYYRAARDGT